MKQDISSDYFVVLEIGGSKLRFGGADGRPWNEQWQDMLAVQMPNQPLVYGIHPRL